MTSFREAVLLPLLLLTVVLLGGLRVADTVRLVPPSIVALMLAAALIGALVRAGALAPERLLHADRSPLENLSGAIVLLTLFGASAQMFNLLTPERGLLFAIFSVYFLIQLMTALAGIDTRDSLLRALVVLFAAAFMLRFAVLESIYAADGGLLKRLMTTLLEGVSLGSIEYQPHKAVTGYAGFVTLVMYLVALALLPARRRSGLPRLDAPAGRGAIAGQVLVATLAVLLSSACGSASAAGGAQTSADEDASRRAAAREDALSRARVWDTPATPVAEADFTVNPAGNGGFDPEESVFCRYTASKPSGTTPKFHCELPDGRSIKVKYGANAELHAEVATTRLLSALGFGADRMYVVRSVRCAGCPRFPFATARCTAATGLERPCLASGNPEREVTFEPAVIERNAEGETIESHDDSGWGWFELDRIDPARGGASRAEVDAFRLLAAFVAHWDNKAPNQRLICPEGRGLPGGGCTAPLAMMQDVGATFGPLKLDLPNWRQTPVWADRATCTVSMRTLPWQGATFPDRRISESGRQMLAGLLGALTERQLTDLFTASRVVSFDHPGAEGRSAAAWVATFRQKVREIEQARCGS